MVGRPGFFDADGRLQAAVDFEAFRAELEAALDRADRGRGSRPPYDAALMFRILVLQALYTLSDGQAEYRLRDRLSFMRFAGFALYEVVLDAKTTWLFRERLTRAGTPARLFERFDAVLHERGYLVAREERGFRRLQVCEAVRCQDRV